MPRAIDIVAARALSADPAARFRTVREMASALRHSVAGLGSPGSERPNRGERRSIRSVFSMWVAVPLVVAIVAAGVVGAGLWLGRLELGGSVGIEIRRGGASTSPPALARPLPVVAITAFDPPPGDGHENDANLPLAIDDHPATVWKSEDYYDGRLNKPGVGVLLDLGAERTVSGFRLDSPSPGFRFAVVVGDDPAAMAATAQPTYRAPDVERDLPPATGRYVLVWITSVVPTPDGSRAEISDVRVYGSS